MTSAEQELRDLRRKLLEMADRQVWSGEAFAVIRELRDYVTERLTAVTE